MFANTIMKLVAYPFSNVNLLALIDRANKNAYVCASSIKIALERSGVDWRKAHWIKNNKHYIVLRKKKIEAKIKRLNRTIRFAHFSRKVMFVNIGHVMKHCKNYPIQDVYDYCQIIINAGR